MFSVFYTTLLTFWRKHLFVGVIFFFLLVSIIANIVGSLVITDTNKVIADVFFALMEIGVSFLIVYFGAYTLADEKKHYTLKLLYTIRQHRSFILIGKALGFLVLLLRSYLIAVIFFAILWYEYDVSTTLALNGGIIVEIFVSSIIKSLLLLSIVLFFDTIINPFLTIITSIGIAFVGHIIQFVYRYILQVNNNLISKGIITFLYYFLPPFSHLDGKETLGYTQGTVFSFLAWGEAMIYAVIVFLLSLILFHYQHKRS